MYAPGPFAWSSNLTAFSGVAMRSFLLLLFAVRFFFDLLNLPGTEAVLAGSGEATSLSDYFCKFDEGLSSSAGCS